MQHPAPLPWIRVTVGCVSFVCPHWKESLSCSLHRHTPLPATTGAQERALEVLVPLHPAGLCTCSSGSSAAVWDTRTNGLIISAVWGTKISLYARAWLQSILQSTGHGCVCLWAYLSMLGSMDREFLTFLLKQTHFGQNSSSLLHLAGSPTWVPHISLLHVSRPQQVFGCKCAEDMQWHKAEAVCPGNRSCERAALCQERRRAGCWPGG